MAQSDELVAALDARISFLQDSRDIIANADPRLIARALEVLVDPYDAAIWLISRNRTLNGSTPIELSQTQSGYGEVERLLGQIECGTPP